MTFNTLSRVSAFTGRVPFTTWDTVDTETPARLATSAMVATDFTKPPTHLVPGRAWPDASTGNPAYKRLRKRL